MPNAKIGIRRAFVPRFASDADNNRARLEWEQVPDWDEAVTGPDGDVVIHCLTHFIDSNRGDAPLPGRDIFTGEHYVVKVESKKGSVVQLELVLRVGGKVEYESIAIEVLEIGTPTYSQVPAVRDAEGKAKIGVGRTD
ncbi:MAG: hypothetical protein AB7V46_18385 [Thermomicrobiales bacterium]